MSIPYIIPVIPPPLPLRLTSTYTSLFKGAVPPSSDVNVDEVVVYVNVTLTQPSSIKYFSVIAARNERSNEKDGNPGN